MSLLASETQNKVAACRAALLAVERQLDPLFARNSTEVARQLAPLENAELQVGLAFTVASLYFCHLLTQGIDPSDHPIKQELDRIQLYFKKIRSTTEEATMRKALKERRQIDTEAAKRIVQHYTNAAEAAIQKKNEIAEESKSRPLLPVGEKPTVTLTPRKKRRLQQQAKTGMTSTEPKQIASEEMVPHSTPTQLETTKIESSRKNVAMDATTKQGVTKEPVEVSLPNETSPLTRKKTRRAATAQLASSAMLPTSGNAGTQLTRSCAVQQDASLETAPHRTGTATTESINDDTIDAAAASVNEPSKTDAELMPPPRTRKLVRKRRRGQEGTGSAPAAEAAAESEAGSDGCMIS